jgi:hypothetical protein
LYSIRKLLNAPLKGEAIARCWALDTLGDFSVLPAAVAGSGG